MISFCRRFDEPGKYNEAEKLLRGALASEEKLLSEVSTELLSFMDHLGCVLGKQGKLEETNNFTGELSCRMTSIVAKIGRDTQLSWREIDRAWRV